MALALTDDEKERIRLEEVYRSEVRNQLAPKTNSWKEFFNSAFSIAILGALLAGLGAGLASLGDYIARSNKEAQDHKDRRERIAREISYRCALFAQDTAIIDKARGLNGELPKSIAYPEFDGTKLYPLLLELEPLVAKAATKKEIESLAQTCRADLNKMDEAKLKEIANKAGSISQDILPK